MQQHDPMLSTALNHDNRYSDEPSLGAVYYIAEKLR
jgi:hypothetical protein